MSEAALLARVLRGSPDSLRVIGRLDGDDVADLAVEDLLHRLAARAVIAPAEAVDEGEVFGLGVLAGLKELAQARAIDGHRFLDERVDPFLDGISQVQRPEVGRGGQEDEVDLIDDVLVCVEAGVLAILGNVDPRADRRPLEDGEVFVDPILEGVGHRDKLDAGVGGEGLLGRAGAPAAAADQTDLDRAAAGRVDQRERSSRSRPPSRSPPPPPRPSSP